MRAASEIAAASAARHGVFARESASLSLSSWRMRQSSLAPRAGEASTDLAGVGVEEPVGALLLGFARQTGAVVDELRRLLQHLAHGRAGLGADFGGRRGRHAIGLIEFADRGHGADGAAVEIGHDGFEIAAEAGIERAV